MTSTLMALDWRLLAACRDHPDPDIFAASPSNVFVEQARAVCSRCPLAVREACLLEGLDYGDDHMIRASFTPAQRRRLFVVNSGPGKLDD